MLVDASLNLYKPLRDALGHSGMAMLEAIIKGKTDQHRLAGVSHGHTHNKPAELVEALYGRVKACHSRMFKLHLDVIRYLQTLLEQLLAAVGEALTSIQGRAHVLTTLPGINYIAAQVLVADISVDMTHFFDQGTIIFWAGLCARNEEYAGKHRLARVRKGALLLKTTLVTAAWTAARPKNSCFQAQFPRITSRRGAKNAILAVVAAMIAAVSFVLPNGGAYKDLSARHFSPHGKTNTIQSVLRRLSDLRCTVPTHQSA